MRTKFLVTFLSFLSLTGGLSAAVVVEKQSRQLPYVEIFGCQGIYSFIFRGETGTSRRPILVPPREYWTAQQAGLYKFVVRYSDGNVCSRLVTPEVFARYQVGDHFFDRPAVREYQSEESKSTETVAPNRHTFAQAWPQSEKPKTNRAVTKDRKARSKSNRTSLR